MLESMGYDLADTRVMIVSNNFHLARVRMLAERCGLNAGTVSAPMPEWNQHPFSYTREAPGAGEILPAGQRRSRLKKTRNVNDKGALKCSKNSNKWKRTTVSSKRS